MPTFLLPALFWGATTVWMVYATRRILRHLLFFQIEEYDNARFARLLAQNLTRVLTAAEIISVCGLAGAYGLGLALLPYETSAACAAPFLLLWAAIYGALLAFRPVPPAKKPLVLTPRATRLLVTGGVLTCALFVIASLLITHGALLSRGNTLHVAALPVLALFALIVDQGIGLIVIAANVVMYPIEASFRRYYVRSATRIMQRQPHIQVVAVTGSYGKTSTKEIIAHVLSSRYRVLKTPRSFNTLMGICKVIREDLQPDHEVFVVEMGAYTPGEIDRLCKLTPPHIGVLTAIGPQHLERFRTIERVAEAKYELLANLGPDGSGIFNGDDPHCAALANRPAVFRVCRYGMNRNGTPLDVWATNVEITAQGTEFDVFTATGATAHFFTALLGEHNVSNILAATSVALRCGLTLQDIGGAVATLEPVEHRLQRIEGAGGVTVIDDAYNANPAGVRMALDVLDKVPGGRKVLITPGMVELGTHEQQEHRQMGTLAAKICDYVILVGPKRTQAIADGLLATGFPPDRLAVVQTLDEATRHLQTFVRPGDVVLFENDLPDTQSTDTIYF